MQSPAKALADRRTPEEFTSAYLELRPEQKRTLMKLAAGYAQIAKTGPEDMLHDAFCEVMENRRPWPLTTELVPFLRGVMRSLASAASRWRAKNGVRDPTSIFGENGTLIHDQADNVPSPEDAAIFAQEFEQIVDDLTRIFAGDDDATFIFWGLIDGMEGEPLRELTGLGPVDFATKRKMVRRRINTYLERRATP